MPVVEMGRSGPNSVLGWTDFAKIWAFGGVTLVVLAISIVSPQFGAASLGLLLAGFVLGVNLKWSILGLIFLVPFDPQVELQPGFYFYFDLLFILPSLSYLWKVVFGKFRFHWSSLGLVPYVLFALASSFWRAQNLFWFSGYSVRLIIAVLFMATIAELGRAETITLVLGVSLVPQVIYGVYQLLAADMGSLYLLVYPHFQSQPWTDRAYGFFFQPNNFGSYCATVSVMLLALGLKAKTTTVGIACYALAGFGFLGLAISGSRGAWLGAIVGLTVLFMFSRAKFGAKVALAVVVTLGLVAAKSLEYAPWARVQELDTFTVDTRTSMFLAALLLFVQHPLIGVGLTNYQVLMSSVVDWTIDTGNAAHNTYLQILSENGIIGFVLFFGPLIYLFHRNLKRAKESTAALLSAAGLTVFLVHGLFDFQFTTAPQYLLLFAILCGLASKAIWEPKMATAKPGNLESSKVAE
jgi:O-antigen ligase